MVGASRAAASPAHAHSIHSGSRERLSKSWSASVSCLAISAGCRSRMDNLANCVQRRRYKRNRESPKQNESLRRTDSVWMLTGRYGTGAGSLCVCGSAPGA